MKCGSLYIVKIKFKLVKSRTWPDHDGGHRSRCLLAALTGSLYCVVSCQAYSIHEKRRQMMAKNVICLWYDGTAEEAARFYAKTFPNSTVTAVHPAPGDYPDGKEGQALTVEFTVVGVPCVGLNGGPAFKHNEA